MAVYRALGGIACAGRGGRAHRRHDRVARRERRSDQCAADPGRPRPTHATFLVNTGPILAHDPAKPTVAQVEAIFSDGNEIGGHTLDHVTVQPLDRSAS